MSLRIFAIEQFHQGTCPIKKSAKGHFPLRQISVRSSQEQFSYKDTPLPCTIPLKDMSPGTIPPKGMSP